MVPSALNTVHQAELIRAESELRILGSALCLLIQDCRVTGIPKEPGSRESLELMVSDGKVPAIARGTDVIWAMPLSDPKVGSFNDYLARSTPRCRIARGQPQGIAGWRGPYLKTPVATGPWRNRYEASVGLLASQECVPIIVSAGRDGEITVPYHLGTQELGEPLGDDSYLILS